MFPEDFRVPARERRAEVNRYDALRNRFERRKLAAENSVHEDDATLSRFGRDERLDRLARNLGVVVELKQELEGHFPGS